ncbi:MAG: universal stress protein [Paludibacter sp.]|nr:universal stress protein [Paludibacter sp.]
MKKNKKVLIVMDQHPSSQKIIEVGYTLAKDIKATVILLHVKVDLVNYSLTYKKMEVLKPDTLENFEVAAMGFFEKQKQETCDDTIQVVVKQGDFAESIFKAAKEMDIDTIVMGSHSTKWLEEMILDRVTDEVLQQTTVHILIVPTRKYDAKSTVITLDK